MNGRGLSTPWIAAAAALLIAACVPPRKEPPPKGPVTGGNADAGASAGRGGGGAGASGGSPAGTGGAPLGGAGGNGTAGAGGAGGPATSDAGRSSADGAAGRDGSAGGAGGAGDGPRGGDARDAAAGRGGGPGIADGGAPDAAVPADRSPADAPVPDSSPPDQPPPPADAAPPPRDAAAGYLPCPAANRVGEFRISLAADFTGVEGQVQDGVIPDRVPVEVQRSGDCRLLSRPGFACSPECVVGQTCAGPPRGCIPAPAPRSVGTVTVTGLKAPLVMMPSGTGYYTNPDRLPHPALDPGAAIRLEAAGGQLMPFSLQAFGISPITVASTPILVETGKAVRIAWTPAPQAGGSRILVDLNINHHGSATNWIECEVADSGAVEIAAPLVTELVKRGASGFPTVAVSRLSVDSRMLQPGCVQLVVSSETDRSVNVAGLTSCRSDDECPAGQTCQADLSCK